jgi:hypothetical protein
MWRQENRPVIAVQGDGAPYGGSLGGFGVWPGMAREGAGGLIHNAKVTCRTAHRSVVRMGRARCDPIDVAATLARLNAGPARPTGHRAYAETAARPYSRASWEARFFSPRVREGRWTANPPGRPPAPYPFAKLRPGRSI